VVVRAIVAISERLTVLHIRQTSAAPASARYRTALTLPSSTNFSVDERRFIAKTRREAEGLNSSVFLLRVLRAPSGV